VRQVDSNEMIARAEQRDALRAMTEQDFTVWKSGRPIRDVLPIRWPHGTFVLNKVECDCPECHQPQSSVRILFRFLNDQVASIWSVGHCSHCDLWASSHVRIRADGECMSIETPSECGGWMRLGFRNRWPVTNFVKRVLGIRSKQKVEAHV
jgi:hypothetical protein